MLTNRFTAAAARYRQPGRRERSGRTLCSLKRLAGGPLGLDVDLGVLGGQNSPKVVWPQAAGHPMEGPGCSAEGSRSRSLPCPEDCGRGCQAPRPTGTEGRPRSPANWRTTTGCRPRPPLPVTLRAKLRLSHFAPAPAEHRCSPTRPSMESMARRRISR